MKEQTESCRRRSGGDLRGSAASAGRRRYAVRLSPLTTVIAASALTIVLLMGLGWQVRQSYLDHKDTQKQVFPIGRLRGRIVHFDEVLTMSANMAAATGDPQWEKRFRQFEPQLDAAIKSLERLVPETFDSAAAIQTDEANIKLVEMEYQVFELVGQNRLEEAQGILSGDDYCEQKALYSEGMERIAADLDEYIAADLESHRKRALIAIVSVLLGLPVLALIWLWVLRNMRRHLKERDQAEQALKESENRFRDFFANAPIGFHIFGPDQIITDINDAELDMIGYTRDEIVGKKTWADLIIPAQAEQFKKHWNDIMTKGNVRNLEYTVIHKQGRHIDVLLNASSRFDETGQFINSRGSILNITERKRVEEELRQSEKRFRIVSGLSYDVLWEWDIPKGVHTWFGDIDKELGFEKNEFPRTIDAWKKVIHPEDYDRVVKALDKHLEEHVPWHEEYRVITKDGNIKYWDDRGETRWDKDGNALIMTGAILDITEHKRAEQSLKLRFDLEELLTSMSTEFISLESDEIDDGIGRVLESIIDTVCVDRGYIFLYSTDGETMDNTHEHCRPGVPPHKDRLQDVPVERFAWFNARMKKFETVAVDSVASLTEEAEAEKKEWLYEDILSLLCVPMVSRDRLMGFVGFDTVLYETQWREEIITFVKILGTVFANALDRKRSGQERERLLKTLAAKNEELQSIVYVASHDLKSPLVNIQGFSGELGKTCEQIDKVLHSEEVPADIQKQLAPLLDEDIPESIGFIRAGTVKMQALLDGLLVVCRVGSAALEIKALDMNEMMKYIIASMQYQITDSGAELTVDDLPGCIGDTDHVNQVFSNLLANAVKYLDPDRKGDIHISGRVEAGESIYCVQDNGLGIAPQHQHKVFEIFHRLEPDRHAEGEGLGLTIALRILERHEGRIWVESEPGKGSKFFVSLPTA